MKLLLLPTLLLAATAAAACTCAKVSNPGLYCWYCAEVKTGWAVDHVYECAKSGKCKDYGVANNCKPGNPSYCDGRDSWKRELEGVESLEGSGGAG